jgi:enterochelin esterase family protein
MPLDIETHIALGLDQPRPEQVNGRTGADILDYLNHPGDAPYHPCPEAYPDDAVPRGNVSRFRDWQQTEIFASTLRDVWVYTPPVPASDDELSLLVFQDGGGYLARNGAVRATAVLDSLHASGDINPTAAVFINPGRPIDGGDDRELAMQQRSIEYDSLTPAYGNFLITEILPFVERECGLKFTSDPTRRTICGISSGGICAFTVAWQHPRSFQRVLSHCGSFTNIRGGHNYPYLIRTTERKHLRIYLQSGENDAATLFGDWPMANRTMARALEYAGYDHVFEFGTGGHSLRHGGALFADSLRWLWRDDAEEQK